MADLSAHDPNLANVSSSFLLNIGTGACSDFQGGDDLQAVLNDADNVIASPQDTYGLTETDANQIIVSGVKSFCPQYYSRLSSG